MSTHWGLDTQERLVHAAEMAEKVNELHAKYECPVIVTGDYNANSSKEEYQLYITNFSTNDVLFDAKEGYELGSAIFHYITVPPKPTATSVNSALDHITYTMGVGAKRAYAITGQTVVRASDHPPIMADFDFMPTFTIDNKQAVTPEKDSFSLRFSQDIEDNDGVKNKDNYTVSDEDGNEAEIVSVTADGNILHFEFKNALKENVGYTIAMNHNGYNGLNQGYEVVAANSREDMEVGKCDVLTIVDGFTKGGSSYAEPNIIKANVADKFKEKRYRYVGIRSNVNCFLNVTEFEVFANGDDFVQALGNVKAEISGTSAIVSSTSATSAAGAGKYTLVVAGYDENNIFTGAKISSIILSSKTALAAPFSVTVEDVVREDTSYVKAFILDDINTLRPIMSYAIQSEMK